MKKMAGNVTPDATQSNSTNGLRLNAVHLAEFFRRAFGHGHNLANLLGRKFDARTPTEVLCERNRLQMVRVDTRRDATQVVEVQTIWDGTVLPLVVHPMSSASLSMGISTTITIGLSALPDPARRFVSSIFNDIFEGRREFRVSGKVSRRLPLNESGFRLSRRQWGLLSATTHAVSRRIGGRQLGSRRPCEVPGDKSPWLAGDVPTTTVRDRDNRGAFTAATLTKAFRDSGIVGVCHQLTSGLAARSIGAPRPERSTAAGHLHARIIPNSGVIYAW